MTGNLRPELTPLPCVPTGRLSFCALNAERSNYTGLGLGACAGLVRAYRRTDFAHDVTTWTCDAHAATR